MKIFKLSTLLRKWFTPSTPREKFVQSVYEEIEYLRTDLTEAQKSRLDIATFNHTRSSKCVYGQIFGHTCSNKAEEFEPKVYHYICNNRLMFIEYLPFGQHDFRKGNRVTALEKYLYMVSTDVHHHILRYIKGNDFKLKIPSDV